MTVALVVQDVQEQTVQVLNESAAWGWAVSSALLGVMMVTALLRLFYQKL